MRAIGLACVALLPLPALANPFCDLLSTLSVGAAIVPEGATCQTSLLMSGQTQRNCYWSYPYRSAEAGSAFAEYASKLAMCLGPEAVRSVDQSVNHPDAYELHLFELNGAEYAVSLKDKGALQKTLVFLRVPVAP